jgi:signal transduction histidine kinase
LTPEIPLLPAERNNVLILFPELLSKVDVVQRTASILSTASATGLQGFLDLYESRDGQVCVAGETGVAWLPGPVRRLDAATEWKVLTLPVDWRLRIQGRAYEDLEAGVVVMAERETDKGVYALRGNGKAWSDPVLLPDGARRAWQGPGGRLWAMSSGQLHRLDEEGWVGVTTPGWQEARLHEVAVQADGSFWVASSSGVARYAQALWQMPAGLPTELRGLRSILELTDGDVWFAGDDMLVRFREGEWQVLSLREQGVGPIVGRVYRLGTQVAFGLRGGRLGLLNGSTGLLTPVEGPEGFAVRKVLGSWGDGRLVVQIGPDGDDSEWRLACYDGAVWEIVFDPPADWPHGAELTSVYFSKTGGIWLGSMQGLASWNDRQGAFLPVDTYPFGPAVSMVDAGGGRLWCATGRDVVEGDGRTWSLLRPSPGAVERLTALRDGSIWALAEGVLKRYWAGSWIEQQSQAGLPNTGVNDVWLDNRGRLWATSGEAVWRQHPEADQEPPQALVVSRGGRRSFATTERAVFLLRGIDRWGYASPDRLVFSTRLNDGAWSPYAKGTVLGLTNLTAGAQRLEVRSMDPGLNEEAVPTVFEFAAFVPWYAEPRIVAVAMAGALVALVLAALAVNRHLRLLRSYAEVERIVEERTRELERANEELVHSQKMRALGTLAAGIAHDFNAILSIIKGSAQIIETNLGEPEKIRTRVDRIRKMVDQGAGIVRAMLGLSRTSRQELRTIQIHPFLEETARLVVDQLPHGVGLHIEPAPEMPPVRVATDLFRQLLINLILNAAEAMAGQGEILLRCWTGDYAGAVVLPPAAKGPQLVIEVLDTGHGIDPEVLPRIFEPFFTTKAFSTRKGTGLGLTMVHEIARELGLGVGVESAPGQGTVFRIYLPLNL